jgi:hypothetical protein
MSCSYPPLTWPSHPTAVLYIQVVIKLALRHIHFYTLPDPGSDDITQALCNRLTQAKPVPQKAEPQQRRAYAYIPAQSKHDSECCRYYPADWPLAKSRAGLTIVLDEPGTLFLRWVLDMRR